MRRMALITGGNGAIIYEGVNIEGTCILKSVDNDKVTKIHESQAEDFAAKRDLLVKYQDPEDQDYWEPRAL
jgi:hypothetical protein